jgi:hypothetical protein
MLPKKIGGSNLFKSKFKYTDRIVELLTKIAAAREVILGSPLIPRWEVSLRKDAIIRSAHSSTSIRSQGRSLLSLQIDNAMLN